MTLFYIDARSGRDFNTVLEFLNARKINIRECDETQHLVRAELSHAQLMELRDLDLEQYLSYGTVPPAHG